jgi:plastocyanin
MKWAIRAGALALVSAVLVTAFIIVAAAGDEPEPVTNATITIHFSRFQPGELTVPAGVPVTFALVNQDPIEHEWIVGDESVHARHRTGTEPRHDQVPTEVTIGAFETKYTTITLDKPGTYTYICHLPGHEAYGMKGTVKVVE